MDDQGHQTVGLGRHARMDRPEGDPQIEQVEH